MAEFDLIKTYFSPLSFESEVVRLGQGDDCALIAPRAGFEYALSTDTLVSCVHFLSSLHPEALGYRCLAVNLSDLAAMGATPRAFMLSLTLPEVDHTWLRDFSAGLGAGAAPFGCSLMGGDLTKGAVLSVTITVIGELATGQAIRRSGMRKGDMVWVSGSLGGAWCGLQEALGAVLPWLDLSESDREAAKQRFERPEPRVALGEALVGMATSALDLSDGLAGDAQHLCRASGLGIELNVDKLPLFSALQNSKANDAVNALRAGLSGGDDYELLFTAPSGLTPQIERIAQQLQVPLSVVGHVVDSCANVRYMSENKQLLKNIEQSICGGFDHF